LLSYLLVELRSPLTTWAAEGGHHEELVELTPHFINLLTNPIVMVSGRPDTILEQSEGSESGEEEVEIEKEHKFVQI
jgi:hypothetical protein